MIKGVQKVEPISWDEILSLTGGGKDVFDREMGIQNSQFFHHPLRVDKHPSATLFSKRGVYFLKDMSGREKTYTALQFIQKKYNYSFKEAIDYIIDTLSLVANNKSSIVQYEDDKKEAHISFTTKDYDNAHAAYWAAYHLSVEFLEKNNVFQVKDLAINRKRIIIGENQLCFAYYAKDIDKCKILRIGVDKKDKWRNNVPGSYIWLKDSVEECNALIVAKSLKDALCFRNLGICAVAVQSESVPCIENNIEWLNNYVPNVYISMGSDEQGFNISKECTDRWGYKWYNTPKDLLQEGINDFAEFVKYDKNKAIEHLKIKNIL